MSIGTKILNKIVSLAQATGGQVEGNKDVTDEMKNLARTTAEEGVVMLKNDGALPLSENDVVAVFGRVQNDWFYVGYGSGGDVKPPYKVNLIKGLENEGVKIDETLKKIYADWSVKNAPYEGFWGHWPFHFDEMPLSDKVVGEAAKRANKAIVVIGRAAGEDREQKLEKGSFYLTDEEKKMLSVVTKNFNSTILIIDNGNIMDLSFIDAYGSALSAALYVWNGGMESGNAVARVLSGKVNPSGRLPDTIAKRYNDYPSAKNFGGKKYNNYQEDVYVGYRFFETFDKTAVRYPFGFGLSYTTFEETGALKKDEQGFFVDVSVKNTGDVPGKNVVAVYVSAPQGELGKPEKILVGFHKTKELETGETEEFIIRIPLENITSFDETGCTGYKSSYVVECGEYKVFLGANVRESKLIGAFYINEPVFTTVNAICPVQHDFNVIYPKYFKRVKYIMGEKPVHKAKFERAERIIANIPALSEKKGDVDFFEVQGGKCSLDEFIACLSISELEMLTHGDYKMNSPLGVKGNAGVFGGISESLREKGVPAVVTTDGPSGIRLMTYASLLPCGTALASTFNKDLVEKLYGAVAEEMLKKGSDVLLAPGMNIHRDPLCGRNFEYFSEDPVLSGNMASAVVKGLQSKGVSACPKHFACNNQETKRKKNDSRVSERALREIYLKGFEICVKTADPKMIMTSYNKVNGVYSCYNFDLCTEVLRNEWGFTGAVTTDWWNVPENDPDNARVRNNAYRVRAGNDVLMPGGTHVKGKYDNSAEQSVNDGALRREELENAARHVLSIMLDVPSVRRKIKK